MRSRAAGATVFKSPPKPTLSVRSRSTRTVSHANQVSHPVRDRRPGSRKLIGLKLTAHPPATCMPQLSDQFAGAHSGSTIMSLRQSRRR